MLPIRPHVILMNVKKQMKDVKQFILAKYFQYFHVSTVMIIG